MKKCIKSNLKVFIAIIVTAVICIGGTVLASVQFQANEVGYKNTTVDKALDDLYDRVSGTKVACLLISGQAETVGSKYACDPGDGNVRYFYVLKANTTNVEMIMEKNLSDEIGSTRTMDYNTAMAFFTTGAGANIKTSWKNIESIDLPDAQTIADAGGVVGFDVATANAGNYLFLSNRIWLYNYTRGNEYPDSDSYPFGYYTKDSVFNNLSKFWIVHRIGQLSDTTNPSYGVRPVITIAKSKLSS